MLPDPAVESWQASFDELMSMAVIERFKTIDRMRLAATGLGLGVRVTFGPQGEMLVEATKDVPLGEVDIVHQYV